MGAVTQIHDLRTCHVSSQPQDNCAILRIEDGVVARALAFHPTDFAWVYFTGSSVIFWLPLSLVLVLGPRVFLVRLRLVSLPYSNSLSKLQGGLDIRT